MSTSIGKSILSNIREQLNLPEYQKIHWEGSFEDYLDIVHRHPEVTRTAYQRLYDMILSHGVEEAYEFKEKSVRYKFFTEYATRHGDGIFGIDRSLVQLVNAFKSAAKGYGTERRVLLLHGPVGSSKSTIARLLKLRLEERRRQLGQGPDARRAVAAGPAGAPRRHPRADQRGQEGGGAPGPHQ